MKTLELDKIRNHPESLVREIESGEAFVVVDGNRAVAEIRPVPEPQPSETSHGEIVIREDFDRPMVLVDDPEFRHRFEHVEEAAPGEYLAWEGNLLVYTGPVPPDLTDTSLIEQTRNERHRQILYGQSE